MKRQEKTSVTVYTDDLKWLKKEKIDRDCKTLADAFQEVREEMESEK